MAPLQRKTANTDNINNDDSPLSLVRKTCPHLNKRKTASTSSSTITSQQQQQSSNYYRQIYIILLVLIATYFVSNMNNPRNFTLNFSYVEIKPEATTNSNSHISSLTSSSENSDNNNNVKKASLISSENLKKNTLSNDIILTDYTGTIAHSSSKSNEKISKEKQNEQKRIKLMTAKDVLREGNPLNSLKLWRRYLHYKVYKFGIPKERKAVHFYKYNGQLPCAFKGYKYTPPKLCSTHAHDNDCDKKMDIRQNRFPSVEERVKYYMGQWYNTTNKTLFSDNFYESLIGESDSSSSSSTDVMDYQKSITGRILINPYDLSPIKMYKFYAVDWKKYKSRDRNAKNYIRDFIDFSIIYNSIKSTKSAHRSPPVLFHHGDGLSSASPKKFLTRVYPVFGKVRDILAEKDNVHHWRYPSTKGCRQCGLKHSNIIWPLNRRRHYSAVASVPKNDIPFDQKIPQVVWRGRIEKSDLVDANLPFEISSWKQRMALVGNHINSTYVNAKFPADDYSKSLPSQYVGSILHMSDMLKYKYLTAIEGNDVSSGLKWMLFSNSVVFIPQPITWESWAMESLLQPFVHYVPVHANMSNIEEMILWCENNPKKAEYISKRSTLFIYDLLFHPDSYMDEEQILIEIVKKYVQNFGGV